MDWAPVIIAGIAAVPSTVAALGVLRNGKLLRTPSRSTIGKQVEDALQTSIANNYRLQAMADKLDVAMPEKAAAVELRVLSENEIRTRAERAERG